MIDVNQAIEQRHSVRRFTDCPISACDRSALEEEIARCNAEGGLHMSLVCDEPQAFDSATAHYGSFRGVRNYIVVAGVPAPDLDKRVGYYGERVVLLAQRLGLNTCWVALTFKRRFVRKSLAAGEELVIVIAVGHGETQGSPHKSRPVGDVAPGLGVSPEWFANGVKAALLAPTAINQQKFHFELADPSSNPPRVCATTDKGPCADIDLGIACLHFELGAGKENFAWA